MTLEAQLPPTKLSTNPEKPLSRIEVQAKQVSAIMEDLTEHEAKIVEEPTLKTMVDWGGDFTRHPDGFRYQRKGRLDLMVHYLPLSASYQDSDTEILLPGLKTIAIVEEDGYFKGGLLLKGEAGLEVRISR